jgi:hypothetical protein
MELDVFGERQKAKSPPRVVAGAAPLRAVSLEGRPQVGVSPTHSWSYATRLSSLLDRQSIPNRAFATVGSK